MSDHLTYKQYTQLHPSLITNFVSELDSRYESLVRFEQDHWEKLVTAGGSQANHQAWEGGYYDHIKQCYDLAVNLHHLLHKQLTFSLDSVFVVLFFHDIEKLFRDRVGFDKRYFYEIFLPQAYSIHFTEEEFNALHYIHGEGNDYRKDGRVMNELAAFCHSCDVLSARCFHDLKTLVWDRR